MKRKFVYDPKTGEVIEKKEDYQFRPLKASISKWPGMVLDEIKERGLAPKKKRK